MYNCSKFEEKIDSEKIIETENEHIINNNSKTTKYHSAENTGQWDEKAEKHIPIIRFIDKDRSTIEVYVTLKPKKRPKHYIEFIALMDGKKEIEIKRFNFSSSPAKAVFKLPDPNKRNYWVVAKCNLHDMWKTQVKK